MTKTTYHGKEYDSFHEAHVKALFDRLHIGAEKEDIAYRGWKPDLVIRGNTTVLVECKGEWSRASIKSHSLFKYEDAVAGSANEVLLVVDEPWIARNKRGYADSYLGFLYYRGVWSPAKVGIWHDGVGFSHARNWKDRISGEKTESSTGVDHYLDIMNDWDIAKQMVRQGKRMSMFQADWGKDVEYWTPEERENR